MIKTRLLGLVPESKKYIAANVLLQWLGLCSNVVMIFTIAGLLDGLRLGQPVSLAGSGAVIAGTIIARILCIKLAASASYHASRNVKKTLRGLLYGKLLRLGPSYTERVATAEVVQLAGEGVEQLETYFGNYMPQFFYALLAPLTLFAVVSPISRKVAVVLLVCVPLIPVAIVAVQKIAKRLLGNYWGQYAALGDNFLENLQGLTTLKIYQADEERQKEMNREAEHFRVITMKVLTMQLNSIIVMDIVAYGGAALGIPLALLEYTAGRVDFSGCFVIVLLSADFFLPMRQLGAYFHVAMNGMAASDKIFRVLDFEEEDGKTQIPESDEIELKGLSFGYTEEKEILHDVSIRLPRGSFTALAGESGCGKSTVAAVLTGNRRGYRGSVVIGGRELSQVPEAELMKRITLISHNSYLFKGTLRDNLLMGKRDAGEAELWEVLKRVRLEDFVRAEGGLDIPVLENGANFSGGQRQRIALARAILHDSPVYIFDEATSNIDVESENDIMGLIQGMAHEKTILLISHRLANIVGADKIYVMEAGRVVQSGTHEELRKENGVYKTLWDRQQALEALREEEQTGERELLREEEQIGEKELQRKEELAGEGSLPGKEVWNEEK